MPEPTDPKSTESSDASASPAQVPLHSGGAPGIVPGLEELPWELPHRFMGIEDEDATFEGARAVILPVPYESTTSYGGGTRWGPRAILDASRYLEVYDQELDEEPWRMGIHTFPQLELTQEGSTEASAELYDAYGRILDTIGTRFPVVLGGEHGISAALVRATAERTEGRLSVLQMDAHADLRDGYQGAPWSHASFARRTLDVADYVQVGLRAVSPEEVAVIRDQPDRVTAIWADEMWESDDWMDRAIDALGERVYLTFDVDYFDPSYMPSTGTPEPGGGDWYRTLRFLRRVFEERTVVGADVVELAPTPGLHAPDVLAAKLVYKLLGYRFHGGP